MDFTIINIMKIKKVFLGCLMLSACMLSKAQFVSVIPQPSTVIPYSDSLQLNAEEFIYTDNALLFSNAIQYLQKSLLQKAYMLVGMKPIA